MFIWRSDEIGCAMAEAVLAAADRGVQVTIRKDRYGVICETCEENRRSFFHPTLTLPERIKSAGLAALYNRDPRPAAQPRADDGTLLAAMQAHPNITLETDENRYDHSKFYLFDGEILILGGINIEDKENGRDFRGRAYQDYMVKLTEPELIADFLRRRAAPGFCPDSAFEMNCKQPTRWFGMEQAYLRLIGDARERLTVVMAYLSPLPAFEQAFLAAAQRGVQVRLLIPYQANFQDDLNKKAASRLIRRSGGKIAVYTYPGMVHTKLLMSETRISLGSCNITKKAFRQLDELNLCVPNGTDFARSVTEAVEASFAVSTPAERLPHRRVMAALESILV